MHIICNFRANSEIISPNPQEMLVIMKFSEQMDIPAVEQAVVTIYIGDYRPIIGDFVDNTVIQKFGNHIAKQLTPNSWEVSMVDVVVQHGDLAYSVILKPYKP